MKALAGDALELVVQLLNALPFYVLIVDEDHKILAANAAFLDRFKLAPREICGAHCPRIVHGTDGSFAGCPLEEAKETCAAVETELHDEAEGTWVASAIYPTEHRTNEGKRVYLHFVRDITAQKDLQREHDELEAQLRQAQKLEAVGQIAGGVAHDFNNILTVIMTHGELIRQEVESAEVLSDVGKVLTAAKHGAALTRQLLAFSRKSDVFPRTLDLNVVIRGVADLLEQALGTTIALELRLAANPWTVSADPVQMEQVLINLVINARDAMTAGGRLVISTENVSSPAADADDGRMVRMSVEDTGAGMSAEVMAQIFEPFFTTKPQGIGTGLGLSTVQRIVRQHQGEIKVASTPGAGTRFDVFLNAKRRRAPSTQVPVVPRVGGARVLIVDDDPAIRSVLRRILVAEGFEVTTAEGGAAALRCLEAGGAQDLLLTDLMMPGLPGDELARLVSRSWPTMKIVCMTGYTEGALRLEHGLLVKPFDSPALLRAIRRALDSEALSSSAALQPTRTG